MQLVSLNAFTLSSRGLHSTLQSTHLGRSLFLPVLAQKSLRTRLLHSGSGSQNTKQKLMLLASI